jgi:hypothetical protein
MDSNLFLSVEQIIPTKDAEEFLIKLAEKALDETENEEAEQRRHRIRREFWARIIDAMAERSDLYRNISAGQQARFPREPACAVSV